MLKDNFGCVRGAAMRMAIMMITASFYRRIFGRDRYLEMEDGELIKLGNTKDETLDGIYHFYLAVQEERTIISNKDGDHDNQEDLGDTETSDEGNQDTENPGEGEKELENPDTDPDRPNEKTPDDSGSKEADVETEDPEESDAKDQETGVEDEDKKQENEADPDKESNQGMDDDIDKELEKNEEGKHDSTANQGENSSGSSSGGRGGNSGSVFSPEDWKRVDFTKDNVGPGLSLGHKLDTTDEAKDPATLVKLPAVHDSTPAFEIALEPSKENISLKLPKLSQESKENALDSSMQVTIESNIEKDSNQDVMFDPDNDTSGMKSETEIEIKEEGETELALQSETETEFTSPIIGLLSLLADRNIRKIILMLWTLLVLIVVYFITEIKEDSKK